MKNSAIKILKAVIAKKNVEKLTKKLNKKTIFTGIFLFLVLVVSFYLIKPYFINFNINKKLIEKKIKEEFKIDLEMNGNISYHILPTPRLKIRETNIYFEKKKNIISLNEINILIPIFYNLNINNLIFKKLIISDEEIKIYPTDIKKYFTYLTRKKKKDIIIKNSILFFLDDQKNKVFFKDFNYYEKFRDNFHTIDINTIFSQNNLKVKFKNVFDGQKKLDIILPQIETKINTVFDSTSDLNNLQGKSKINFFNNILVINFEGKNKYKIFNSFLRNKFLNTKIEGSISLFDNFLFFLKFDINQIKLRKLLLNYFPDEKELNFFDSKLSKKINGKLDISLKNTNSFIGRINDLKMNISFENGDLKVQNGSAILPNKSKVDFSLFFSDNSNEPFLDFNLNFSSKNVQNFLRKLNIYEKYNDEILIVFQGKINLINNKIKFKNILLNNKEKLDRQDIVKLEKSFNEFVLDEGIFGLTDFFKIKKFVKSVLN